MRGIGVVAGLLLSCSCWAAITIVQPSSGGSSTCVSGTCTSGGMGSKSVTLASTPTIGDVIVIGMSSQWFPSCTDNQSPPNSYMGQNVDLALSAGSSIFVAKVVTATGTFTITCSNTNGYTNLVVSEWSGLSTYVESLGNGTGLTGGAYNCGGSGVLSVATGNTDLLMDFETDNGSTSSGTFTPTTGFTMLAGQNNGSGADTAGMEYRVVTAGTYTPAPQYSGQSSGSACISMAIRASFTTGAGTITRVQNTKVVDGTSVSFGSLPAVGDTVVVSVGGVVNNVTCGDNQSPANAYVGIARQRTTPNGIAAIFAGYVKTSSGTYTVSCSDDTGSAFVTIYIIEYSGVLPEVDVNAAGADTAPYACGSYTTTHVADLLLSAVEDPGNSNASAAVTAGSGFTMVDENNDGTQPPKVSGIQQRIVSSTGSFSPTMSATGQSATNDCVSVALKAGSLGATVVYNPFVINVP